LERKQTVYSVKGPEGTKNRWYPWTPPRRDVEPKTHGKGQPWAVYTSYMNTQLIGICQERGRKNAEKKGTRWSGNPLKNGVGVHHHLSWQLRGWTRGEKTGGSPQRIYYPEKQEKKPNEKIPGGPTTTSALKRNVFLLKKKSENGGGRSQTLLVKRATKKVQTW